MAERKRDFGRKREMIGRVQEYIGENLGSRLTIGLLAEIFHISATQLKKNFKEVTGTTIYAYVRSRRMQMAADLLARTDQTILDVAGQCGYDNGSKFAKAFRDVMGCNPREYRNREH